MDIKKILIIAVIIIVILLILRNQDKISAWLGFKPSGAVDPNVDVGSVALTDVQSTIDGLLKTQADLIASGDADSGQMLTIQKKVQVFKLEQKTKVQFAQHQINTLMSLSLLELTALNNLTTQELYELVEALKSGGDITTFV